MLIPVCVYQIIVWSITLYYTILGLVYLPDEGYLRSLLVKSLVAMVLIFLIYSNICLLFKFKKNSLKTNLNVNRWVNFVQIIYFSFFGLSFLISVGTSLKLYYSYDEIQDIQISFKLVELELRLSYVKSNLILAGVNIIPLALFIFFNKLLDKVRSAEEKALVDSFN